VVDQLAGRIALVTGAGRGIGRAIALEYARAGAELALVALEGDELETVASEVRALGCRVFHYPADVSHDASVNALIVATLERFGRIDILVNNAGTIVLPDDLVGATPEGWDRTMAVNARAAFLLCQGVIPGMRERDEGRIINIASTAGLRGLPSRLAYCASKHALVGFTRALAEELKVSQITVNAICPGAVKTSLTLTSRPDVSREGWLEPEDVARVALFIAGTDGAHMHGAILEMRERSPHG